MKILCKVTQFALLVLNVAIIGMSIWLNAKNDYYAFRASLGYILIPVAFVLLCLINDSRGPQMRAFKLFKGLNYLWNAMNQAIFNAVVITLVEDEIREKRSTGAINVNPNSAFIQKMCYIGTL